MRKGEVYQLGERFRDKLGTAHGYLWVYEGRVIKGTILAFDLTRNFLVRFSNIDLHRLYAANEGVVVAFKGERKWGKFRSVSTGHAMEMPTFAVVVEKENLMRKILRRIECLSS